jgi:hypothetical protein
MASRKTARLGDHTDYNASAARVMELHRALAQLTKKLRIEVEHKSDYGFDDAYIGKAPFDNHHTITIGDMFEERCDLRGIISILHEVGHFHDFIESGLTWSEYVNQPVKWVPETGAWKHGVDVGKEIGFSEWDAYNRFAARCLSTYSRGIHENADAFVTSLKEYQGSRGNSK